MASVLVTGRGVSGSWIVRGVQLGTAIGAHVEALTLRSKAELVIGVKRIPQQMAMAYRGRLVWDVVDAYPQPHGNDWDEAACHRWMASEIERLKPIALIAATNQMARDLTGYGLPVLWLPHHYRPGLERNPIRERVEVIGYEGSPAYIEKWRPAIESACKQFGTKFVLNPPRLADLDIVLALRGAIGYAPRKWKSNVKLANAHGSGTPFIGSPEAGYIETMAGPEYWAEEASHLAVSIGHLLSRERRMHVQEKFLKAAFSLEEAASKLSEWLKTL